MANIFQSIADKYKLTVKEIGEGAKIATTRVASMIPSRTETITPVTSTPIKPLTLNTLPTVATQTRTSTPISTVSQSRPLPIQTGGVSSLSQIRPTTTSTQRPIQPLPVQSEQPGGILQGVAQIGFTKFTKEGREIEKRVRAGTATPDELKLYTANLGTPKSVLTSGLKWFHETIAQPVFRTGSSLVSDIKKEEAYTPTTKAEKFLLGEDPVKSFATKILELPENARLLYQAVPDEIKRKYNLKPDLDPGVLRAMGVLSPFLVAGSTFLDLTPLPGSPAKLTQKTINELTEKTIKTHGAKFLAEFAQKYGSATPIILSRFSQERLPALLEQDGVEVLRQELPEVAKITDRQIAQAAPAIQAVEEPKKFPIAREVDRPPKTLPKVIAEEDRKVMEQFIDDIRLNPSSKRNSALEVQAAELAEDYAHLFTSKKVPKTSTQLANQLDDLLARQPAIESPHFIQDETTGLMRGRGTKIPPQQAFGAMAGAGTGWEYDEETGEYRFNPERAAKGALVGIIGIGAIKKLGPKKSYELFQLSEQEKLLQEAIKNHPAYPLTKYANKIEGTLGEVTGGKTSFWKKYGDSIATETGFPDSDAARESFEGLTKMRQELKSVRIAKKDLIGSAKREAKGRISQLARRPELSLEEKAIRQHLPESSVRVLSSSEGEIRAQKPVELRKTGQPPRPPKGPIGLSSEEERSFGHIIRQADISAKQKVNIIDYVLTPEDVLKKIGLEKEVKILRKADETYRGDLKKEITQISNWIKKVPSKESSKKIFQFLDGKSVGLTPEEQKVANEIKAYLSVWADKLGLPEDRRISNYVTHIFEKDFIQKEFDPDLAKIITDKIPGSVYDPFLQRRLGKLGYKENVWAALDAYVKRATRKVNMDPALAELEASASDLPLESYRYVQRYAARINLRPTETDVLIDNFIKASPIGYKFTSRPTAYLTQKWRQMIYRGTLGLNIGSALKNLTQGINTYAKLGGKYTLSGYFDLLRQGSDELYKVGVLDDNIIQDRTFHALKGAMEKLDKGLWKFFDTAEKINRGSAYYGAKRKALDLGKSEAEAIEFAKDLVGKTQFRFGVIDSPVFLSSDWAKTFAQLLTYNVKQAEFLTNMAKNKEWGGLLRFTGAGIVVVATIGKLFGMDYEDLIPSMRIGGTPIATFAKGVFGLASTDREKRKESIEAIKKTGFLTIPGGAQIKKTFEGLKSIFKGEVETKAGKKAFEVEPTTGNVIRSALFGKYSTGEAEKSFEKTDKLFKALGEQDEQRDETRKRAEALFEEWDNLTPEQARQNFFTLAQTNPELAEKISEIGKERQLGLTTADRLIKQLNVKNGARARFLVQEFQNLETDEEKRAYWDELVSKKLITEEVATQIKQFIAQPALQ